AGRGEHAAARLEHLAGVFVDDEIEVPLAVADLDVLQTVPLLRQRDEALGEELELRRPDRQLVGLRAEEMPGDADEIPEVEQLEHRKVALAERVLADVDLDRRTAVGNRQEVRLAEAADREDPSRGRRLDAPRFELLARLRAVRLDEAGDGVGPREDVRVRHDAEALQFLEVR